MARLQTSEYGQGPKSKGFQAQVLALAILEFLWGMDNGSWSLPLSEAFPALN